jgi:PAS domain S-box-containing protein
VWVSWTNKAIKNQYGEFVEILAIGNDVTSLKRTEQDLRASEKRLRLATDAAQLGIFDWDIENDVTLWDRRMYEIFGMQPDEQPVNREGFAKELIYPADLQRFNEKITKSLNKESTFSGSYRIRRHSDQQVRWIQYFGQLELSGDGKPIRLISTLADVTERKEAEKEIRESEERLRILNDNLENLVIKRTEQVRELSKTLTLAEQRERKQFSHILHEDIQQKLFGARMLFKQYLRDLQISEHDSFKEDVEDGISVLEQAIKTSKALSIELNPPVLTTEGLDAALRWLVTHMHNTYGLNIELQICGKVENIRNETQLMMTQMIREILNNVKKHSGVMDVILRVRCKDENLVVSVKDSGCGFDPSKTFEKKKDNNRLGLLSMKERLNLFGGALTIKSEQGKGTVVKIFLPQQNC